MSTLLLPRLSDEPESVDLHVGDCVSTFINPEHEIGNMSILFYFCGDGMMREKLGEVRIWTVSHPDR
jgi:hypothetical protein